MSSTLVIGGVRSGKSAWAVRYSQRFNRKVFIATASAIDEDMKERINRHQQERGDRWRTIEAGKDIVKALQSAHKTADIIVIDCLTVWTALIMNEAPTQDQVIQNHVIPLINKIERIKTEIVIVTNEVGMGVHPEYESGRQYRDLLGKINQSIAAVCENVILFVAGIPLAVKGTTPNANE